MTNQIVTVTVSTQQAPTPNTLQQQGAIISQGATTLTNSTDELLTTAADLADIIRTPLANTSLTWSGSVVTVTTAAAHGIPATTDFEVTIAGVTPSAYNGTFLATRTGASTFTYPLVSDPGSETIPGTWVPASVALVQAAVNTFFAQGRSQAVYILELGYGTYANGVTSLAAYILANRDDFYGFLVPPPWSGEATYFTGLLDLYEDPTAKLYFWSTATLGNYTTYTAEQKCAFVEVEAPLAPATECTVAAAFYKALAYRPGPTTKVTPFAFSEQFGVTAYPTRGNGSDLAALKAAYTNVIETGAEGGLSNDYLFWGTTRDGRDFTYWYSVDWVQIHLDENLANAIINGSNDPINPLYYNQNGIDRLQAVAGSTMGTAVQNGLALGSVVLTQLTADALTAALDAGTYAGQIVVNAIPFIPYVTAEPSDYPAGIYNGLSVTYIPARGFTSIQVSLVVSDFVAGA